MRVTPKLVLAIWCGFLPILAADAYFAARREVRLYKSDIRRDLRLVGATLGGAVAYDWTARGPEHAIQLVQAADRENPRMKIRWVPVTSDAAGQPGSTREDPDQRLISHQPVVVAGVRVGTIELSESRSPVWAYRRSATMRVSLLTLALFLVTLPIAAVLGNRILGGRLRLLTDQARRIGSGDLGARVGLAGRDEVALLGRHMNEMAERLELAHARADQANSDRLAALEQLRHTDRLVSVGRLASCVAHELGTPLSVVLGRAKSIESGELDAAGSASHARIIRDQAQRMADSIRSMLGFVRKRPEPMKAVDLHAVLKEVVDILGPLAARQRSEIILSGHAGPAVVRGRSDQIQQVVVNLVMNAIDAMPDGGRVEIEVQMSRLTPEPKEARAPTNFVCLSVKDGGVGIPDDDLARLFEPFFSSKPEGQGTGLGLWIADGIVRDHGGWIDVETKPDAGTRFTLYLPAENQECVAES